MELKINVVEAAAELAEILVNEHFNYSEPNNVYTIEENGDTIYTEQAQDVFNARYDEIFTKLIDARIGPLPTIGHKVVDTLGLVEKMSHQATDDYFMTTYHGHTNEAILDMMWELGKLNEVKYTSYGQRIYNQAEEKFLLTIMEFEV